MKTIAYICSYEQNQSIAAKQLAEQCAEITNFCKCHDLKLEEIFTETGAEDEIKPVLLNIMSTFYKKADRLIITNYDILSRNIDFRNWVTDEFNRINIEIICLERNDDTHFFAEKTLSYLTNDLQNIPSNPEIIKHAIEIMQNKNADFHILENIILQDIGLCSRILKLANSAYYGFPKQISTIRQAITILGLTTIKGVILSAGFVKNNTQSIFFNYSNFQKQAILCAETAKRLAIQISLENPEEIYIGALLRDMGKIIFAQFDKENYSKIYKNKNFTDEEFIKKEEEICGLNHCELANMVAYAWNFPEIISEIITYHHKPKDTLKFRQECAVVYLSETIIKNKMSNENLIIDKKNEDLLEILKISEDNINSFRENLIVSMEM